MNKQRQDDAMDRDLQDLSQAYREAIAGHGDEPPASLDSAILAAAHRETGSKPASLKKPRVARWQIPLATAAVVVISSTVALIGIHEPPDPDTPSSAPQASAIQHSKEETSAAVAPPPPPQSEPPAAAMPKPAPAPAAAAAQRTLPEKKRSAVIPAVKADARISADAPIPSVAPFPASPREKTEAEKDIAPQTENARRQISGMSKAQTQSARQASAFPADEKALPAMGLDDHAELSQESEMAPDTWLAQIERLYKQGRIEEARASLEKFRRAYPHYEIPKALKTL